MHGLDSDDTSSSGHHILPPCKVCGEPGTGFHYGVTTCGACKGFFRRSIVREEPYECVNSRLCHLGGAGTNRRQSCPKCRYDKCIAVGMSRDACKVGRYTLIKKSKDMEEAMKFHQNYQFPQAMAVTNKIANKEAHHFPQITADVTSISNSFLDLSMKTVSPSNTHPSNFMVDHISTDQRSEMYLPVSSKSLYREGQLETCSPQEIDNFHSPYHNNIGDECPLTESFSIQDWNSNNHSQCSRKRPHGNLDDQGLVLDKELGSNTDNSFQSSVCEGSPSYAVLESCTNDSLRNTMVSSWLNNQTLCSYDSPALTPVGPTNHNVVFPSQLEVTSMQPDSIQTLNESNQFNLMPDHTLEEKLTQIISHSDTNNSYPDISSQTTEQFTEDVLPSPIVSSSPVYATVSDCTPVSDDTSRHVVTPQQFPDTTGDGYAQTIHQFVPDCSNAVASYQDVNTFDDSGHTNNINGGSMAICPSTAKRKRLSDSPTQSSQGTITSLASVLKDHAQKMKPFTLYIVAPDPMKYTLSIFDRFPFRSFEKQSLAPLLKMCYDSNDWIEDYLYSSNNQHDRIWSNNLSKELQRTSTLQTPSILPSEQFSKLDTPAREMTNDSVEMEELLNYLLDNYCHHYGPESAFLSTEENEKYQEMYVKICQLHDSLKGKLNLIDNDTYYNILETTGIDVDRRREWFSCVFQGFDEAFTRDTKFFRSLPGFRQLSLRDRITLTKATFPILLEFRHNQTTNFEADICINQERGVAIRVTVFRLIVPGFAEFVEEWQQTNKAVQDLELSFEEQIILNTLFIMVPENLDGLDNPELVKEWRGIYMECLLHLLKKRLGSKADARFQSIVDVLQTMKVFCERKMAKNAIALLDTIRRLAHGQGQLLLIQEVLSYWETYPRHTCLDHQVNERLTATQ